MSEPRKQRRAVIGELVDELTPVKHAGRPLRFAIAWLIAAFTLIGGLMVMRGPFRAGSLDQLLTHPQFALESLLGAAAVASLAVAAFHRTLPAVPAPVIRLFAPLLLAGGWLALTAYGLHDPALAPSMAGKRELCHLEVFVLGIPALALGIAWLRPYYPLHGVRCGLLIGLAAGAIPALLMQFACMYVVPHILQHHFLPAVALVPVGALAGAVLLKSP